MRLPIIHGLIRLAQGLRYRLASLVAFAGIAFAMEPQRAWSAAPDDWYYHEGALAGSLRNDHPLPLYDDDPGHLWNRLFAALYIRSSELPSRSPDSSELTPYERDLGMRSGQVPPGPVVRRIEGGDVMEFRLAPKPSVWERGGTGSGQEGVRNTGSQGNCRPPVRIILLM